MKISLLLRWILSRRRRFRRGTFGYPCSSPTRIAGWRQPIGRPWPIRKKISPPFCIIYPINWLSNEQIYSDSVFINIGIEFSVNFSYQFQVVSFKGDFVFLPGLDAFYSIGHDNASHVLLTQEVTHFNSRPVVLWRRVGGRGGNGSPDGEWKENDRKRKLDQQQDHLGMAESKTTHSITQYLYSIP